MENLWLLGAILLLVDPSPGDTAQLEQIECEQDPQLTCAQDLTDCTVKDGEQARPDADPVQLDNLEVKALLCCWGSKYCTPCLSIKTYFTVPEESADHGNDGSTAAMDSDSRDRISGENMIPYVTEASVTVCYTPANAMSVCKVLEFTVPPVGVEDQDKPEVWLSLVVSDKLAFGSHVFVSARPLNRSITIPSVQEVCKSSLSKIVNMCDLPRLHAVIDHEKGVARLELDSKARNHSFLACLKYNEKGDCRFQTLKHTENISIPLPSVTPCLCVQAKWMKPDALRVESCPFKNSREFLINIWKNTNLSVEVVRTTRDHTALSWRLEAPCRVEADVWLCKRRIDAPMSNCEEVQGTRTQLRNKTNYREHWGKGEFVSIVPHPGLCVVAKVWGMSAELDHKCPFAADRKRWSLTVFVSVVLLCLVILMSCVLSNSIKRNLQGGHVVLLYPPDPEEALPGLICWLGSWLSTAGFSVSGDLWSRADVCSLGPVPWLHSQLERQRRCGGKVVLVLTRTAMQHAEDWALAIQNCHTTHGKAAPRCSPYSDVFTAALGCILSDCQQGHAGERFALVQFESLPALPLQSKQPLPEPFRGLTLYSLPCRSSDLVAELLATRSGAKSWAVGLQAGLWARMLGPQGHRGIRAHRLSGLSLDSAVSVLGSLQETDPLQPSASP